MNAFESGARKCIPAVLVYLSRKNGEKREYLMIERIRSGDHHQGRYNGLGGKCEADESYLQAAIREVREESGWKLETGDFKWLGLIHFPNFKAHRSEDWMVAVFSADVSEKDIRDRGRLSWRDSGEGILHWIPEGEILNLPLWPGDRRFLPWVFEGRRFAGTLWYRDGTVEREEWVNF